MKKVNLLRNSKAVKSSLIYFRRQVTGFLTRVRRKIVSLKEICDDPEKQEQDRLSSATTRLAGAWQEYANSQ